MLPDGYILRQNKIIKHIGGGAFSEVFLSQNTGFTTPVALKVCKLSVDPKDKARFLKENEILHHLHTPEAHSKIIFPLSKVDEEHPYTYYIMELADFDLDKYLNSDYDSFNDEKRIKLFQKICDGLEHAHKKDVVHRDLWWKNALMLKERTGEYEVKLSDFGRAKDFSSIDDLLSSSESPCLGHQYIRPPESHFNILNNPSLNDYVAIDMYALGVMLYYIFTGKPDIYYLSLQLDIATYLKQNKVNLAVLDSTARLSLYKNWVDARRYKSFGLDISILDKALNEKLNRILKKLCDIDSSKRYKNINEIKTDISRLAL